MATKSTLKVNLMRLMGDIYGTVYINKPDNEEDIEKLIKEKLELRDIITLIPVDEDINFTIMTPSVTYIVVFDCCRITKYIIEKYGDIILYMFIINKNIEPDSDTLDLMNTPLKDLNVALMDNTYLLDSENKTLKKSGSDVCYTDLKGTFIDLYYKTRDKMCVLTDITELKKCEVDINNPINSVYKVSIE